MSDTTDRKEIAEEMLEALDTLEALDDKIRGAMCEQTEEHMRTEVAEASQFAWILRGMLRRVAALITGDRQSGQSDPTSVMLGHTLTRMAYPTASPADGQAVEAQP